MMTLMIAAAVAAQPAPVPANTPAQQMSMMQMAGQQEHAQHGQMADMKDCCCKDMMAKMHEGHRADHDGHSDQ